MIKIFHEAIISAFINFNRYKIIIQMKIDARIAWRRESQSRDDKNICRAFHFIRSLHSFIHFSFPAISILNFFLSLDINLKPASFSSLHKIIRAIFCSVSIKISYVLQWFTGNESASSRSLSYSISYSKYWQRKGSEGTILLPFNNLLLLLV